MAGDVDQAVDIAQPNDHPSFCFIVSSANRRVPLHGANFNIQIVVYNYKGVRAKIMEIRTSLVSN